MTTRAIVFEILKGTITTALSGSLALVVLFRILVYLIPHFFGANISLLLYTYLFCGSLISLLGLILGVVYTIKYKRPYLGISVISTVLVMFSFFAYYIFTFHV